MLDDTPHDRDAFRLNNAEPHPTHSSSETGALAPYPAIKAHKPKKCPITPRQAQVLTWIALGNSDWEIGHILMLSPKTVNYHVEQVKRSLRVRTRSQAVAQAVRLGWLEALTTPGTIAPALPGTIEAAE
jgi:DNA-binding CsgD family transcriptional regulator